MTGLDPRTTALIVVDMQNDFIHPDGETARWMRKRLEAEGRYVPPDPELLADVTAHLNGLIDDARAAGVTVVWARMENTPETQHRFMAELGWNPCIAGTWGARWHEAFAPGDGELVVTKHRHSAFFGTTLDAELRARGIDAVAVTGTATQGCVESTVRDACDHDYRTLVVGDCCIQLDQVAHEQALARIARVFGERTTAADLRVLWAGDGVRG